MADRLSDKETAKAPAARPGIHEDVAQPGERGLIGDQAGIADLSAIRCVQPYRKRVLD